VIDHLKKRLDSGDYDTVKFFKAMYPTGDVQKCLICKREVEPGSKKKCVLHHDVDWFEFEDDGYRMGNGTHFVKKEMEMILSPAICHAVDAKQGNMPLLRRIMRR
jgi:hypothetical protein